MHSSPEKLKSLQRWFAQIITQPLIDQNFSQSIAPSGKALVDEAAKYIIPSPTLQPHERIQLYNQQYWWRLTKILSKHFPFVTRLFGYNDFNDLLAVPYLLCHPPVHWSLNILGEKFPSWVRQNYHDSDRKLVLRAATLDWAFESGYITKQLAPICVQNASETQLQLLVESPMRLQPHIQLFDYDCNFLEFRQAFLNEEVDYWLENDFPPLAKDRKYFFVLHRDADYRMAWKEISPGEWFLLKQFKKPCTIAQACQELETVGGELYEESLGNIHAWFREWTANDWLSLKKR